MPEVATRELTFAQAIRESARGRDAPRFARVILGKRRGSGTPFKVLSGLVEEFGQSGYGHPDFEAASRDGVGAAMTGLRPVVESCSAIS